MKHEKFFNGGNFKHNAVLSWDDYNGNPYNYINGYFSAANLIAGSLLREDFISEIYRNCKDKNNNMLFDMVKDEAVFPMVFMYRHYIELSLKYLLSKIYIILQKTERSEKHSLESLGNKIINELKEVQKKCIKIEQKDILSFLTEFKKAHKLCVELNNFDKCSEAMRYSCNKNGDLFLSNEKPLNIELFMETMQEIRTILVWGDDLLSALIEKEEISKQ